MQLQQITQVEDSSMVNYLQNQGKLHFFLLTHPTNLPTAGADNSSTVQIVIWCEHHTDLMLLMVAAISLIQNMDAQTLILVTWILGKRVIWDFYDYSILYDIEYW